MANYIKTKYIELEHTYSFYTNSKLFKYLYKKNNIDAETDKSITLSKIFNNKSLDYEELVYIYYFGAKSKIELFHLANLIISLPLSIIFYFQMSKTHKRHKFLFLDNNRYFYAKTSTIKLLGSSLLFYSFSFLLLYSTCRFFYNYIMRKMNSLNEENYLLHKYQLELN